jgi:putative ABC transport system permease protein
MSQSLKAISPRLLVFFAWRNLISKKLRTFLTMFGIIIGIGAIFFLLSFGIGLQRLVTQQVIGDRSIKAIDVTSPNSRIIKLNTQAANRFSELGHVERVGRSYSFPGILKLNGAEQDMVTYGVDEAYQGLSSLNVVNGRALANTDTHEVLVNRAAIAALGMKQDKEAIGKTVNITVPLIGAEARQKEIQREFRIVGVVDSGAGGELFLPIGIFDAAGVSAYSQIKVVADDTKNVPDLRKQIESQGFQTTSPIDTLGQINQIFRFFTLILASFGAIGMIVAVLGMFNTLTISLLERTKEIGLMMALGARTRDMRRLFVFEAVLLSLAGSVIGIGMAIISGMAINIAMNSFARHRGVTESFDMFATPWWLILGMILFMVLVGLAVVFFPARRAAKINPIDALRRE